MHHPLSAALALGLVLWASPTPAQDLKSQLIGVWRWTSHVYQEVGTDKTTPAFGERPNGLFVFTRGGHFVWTVVSSERKPPPAAGSQSDADRAALYNSMGAASGTYATEGTTLSMTYQTAWNHVWTGTTQKRQIEIQGNRMTMTSTPARGRDGKDYFFVVTYDRVE